MDKLLLKALYTIFRKNEEDSVETSIEGSDFIIKLPVKNGVGRLKLTLDSGETADYFMEYPDGGQAFLHEDQNLFGEYQWGARMPPRSCFCCGGVSVINEAHMEYETKFYTRDKFVELCDDCEEYVRKTIYRQFAKEKPEAILSTKI